MQTDHHPNRRHERGQTDQSYNGNQKIDYSLDSKSGLTLHWAAAGKVQSVFFKVGNRQ